MENRNREILCPAPPPKAGSCPLYRVQAGCYGDPARAEQVAAQLCAQGYRAFVISRKQER